MKKLFAISIIALIILGFTACGNDDTVDLLIWGPHGAQEFLAIAAERFEAMHPDTDFNFTFGVVGEDMALERVSEDPASAADVFAFADDHLRDFVNAGMLYEVTRNVADIRARNMDSAVDIATLDGRMWAYPQTADNGYFWYYDRSVLSSEDVLTLDRIIEVSLANDRRFTFPIDEAWVTASWFLAQGNLSLEDGQQVVDFNNAHGLAAAQAMVAMVESGAWTPGWANELEEGIGTTLSGGVGGTWMAANIQETLGENFGVTKLPTATIGGRQVQLSSFMGTKLVGVNSQTEHPVYAMDFADFLTSEAMQLLNFEMNQIGPSNIVVAQSPAVLANPALAALAYQSMFAFPQRDVQGSYWGPIAAFGAHVANSEVNAGNMQDKLDEMVAQIMGN